LSFDLSDIFRINLVTSILWNVGQCGVTLWRFIPIQTITRFSKFSANYHYISVMKYKTESWKCESLMKINVRVILTLASCFVNFDRLFNLKCVFSIVDILHRWLSTLHVFHLIQKFNMASTTNSFWCWSFKIFSETTRWMNMLFCRNNNLILHKMNHWKYRILPLLSEHSKSYIFLHYL
jgi:hypothetical protein